MITYVSWFEGQISEFFMPRELQLIFQERDKRLEPTDSSPDIPPPLLGLESEVLRVVDPGHQVLVLRVEHSTTHGPVLPGTTVKISGEMDNFTCEGVHRLLLCDQRGWSPW